MNCPVSVWIDYYEELPVQEAVRKLSEAGFNHGELSIIHLAQIMEAADPEACARQLRVVADDLGYAIPQGHLSFYGGLCDDGAMERLKPELEVFRILGVRKAVLHVGGGRELHPQERYDRWVRYIAELSEFVEGEDITLCLENLMSIDVTITAQGLLRLLRDAGDRNLGICLDTGHLHLCNKTGKTAQTHGEFIRTAADRLQALHITDNNGVADTHQMPFSARYGVDWQDVMTALRDIGYSELFNLEILGERGGDAAIKRAKLDFIRAMTQRMLSDSFIGG